MDTLRGEEGPSQWQLSETFFGTFFSDSEMPLVISTKVTKGTGPVRRLGKIEHGTSCLTGSHRDTQTGCKSTGEKGAIDTMAMACTHTEE